MLNRACRSTHSPALGGHAGLQLPFWRMHRLLAIQGFPNNALLTVEVHSTLRVLVRQDTLSQVAVTMDIIVQGSCFLWEPLFPQPTLQMHSWSNNSFCLLPQKLLLFSNLQICLVLKASSL